MERLHQMSIFKLNYSVLNRKVGVTMRRRFVIGIDGETPHDVSAFNNYIQQQGFGWWHWFDNFWLLTTYDNTITAAAIRDKLVEISNRKRLIVIEITSIIWANFGPQGSDNNANDLNISKWLLEEWDK